MKCHKILFHFLLLICCSAFAVFPQKKTNNSTQKFSCYQKKSERLKLIKEADSNPYRIHHIAFWGNIDTRDKTLRSDSIINEGDVFSQSRLREYVENINALKIINPIQIKDIKIALDSKTKDVDLVFCVSEKKNI